MNSKPAITASAPRMLFTPGVFAGRSMLIAFVTACSLCDVCNLLIPLISASSKETRGHRTYADKHFAISLRIRIDAYGVRRMSALHASPWEEINQARFARDEALLMSDILPCLPGDAP